MKPLHKLVLVLFVQFIYQLTCADHPGTKVNIRKTRSVHTPYHLEVSAWGKKHKLRLKRMSSELSDVFSSNFAMQSQYFNKKTQQVHFRDITPSREFIKSLRENVYSDPNILGSHIHIKRNANGGLMASGFLSHDKTISSYEDKSNKTIQHAVKLLGKVCTFYTQLIN